MLLSRSTYRLEVDTRTELVIPDFMIVKLLFAIEPPLGFKGLREPIFLPEKGNYEQLLKHTQFMVDYVRQLNIFTTTDGNMHYVSLFFSFVLSSPIPDTSAFLV